jgi:hypothetical protein
MLFPARYGPREHDALVFCRGDNSQRLFSVQNRTSASASAPIWPESVWKAKRKARYGEVTGSNGRA